MGGIDWSGVEFWADMYGIEDLDGLMERLLIIKTHTPPETGL